MVSRSSDLELFLRHRERLIGRAAPIVRCPVEAEDVVQEAFIRFSARAGDDAEVSAAPVTAIRNPVGYLYRIVRNLALDRSRRVVRGPIQDAIEDLGWIPADAPSPEQVALDRDRLRTLETALARLPVRTRTAFIMRRLEGKSFKEIADHLDVSVARAHQLVKDAMRQALQHMREAGALE